MGIIRRFKSSLILGVVTGLLLLAYNGYASFIVLRVIELFVGLDVDKAIEIACNNADTIGNFFLVLLILFGILTFVSVIRNIIAPKVVDEDE